MTLGPVSFLLLSPLIGALTLLFVPRTHLRVLRGIALASVTLSLGFALWIFVKYDSSLAGFQFVDKISWIPQIGVSYHVGVDGMNAILLLLTAFCSFAGVYQALAVKERTKEFLTFYLFLIVGCFGVLASLDLFFMYFFYETAVIPVFPLIGVWGSGRKEYASMKLTLYLTLGAVLALFAIFAVYLVSGIHSFDFPLLHSTLASNPLPVDVQRWAFPLVMVGFGVILTLWPFHTWSPVGYACAPTAVSMLHAGVLKKLGAYMILRLGITLMPDGAAFWMPWVASIAVINIVYCGLVAFTQRDLKYILGYSSCSHMGIILLGLSCLNPVALNGTLYYMFAHGIMAALGFALVGFVYDQTHTRNLEDWGGLGKKIPFVSTVFVMTALASAGVPGFANFIGEIMILAGAWETYRVQTILAVTGLVITAGYMLKTVRWTMQGPVNPKIHATLADAGAVAKLPLVMLMIVLLIGGIFPSILLNKSKPSVERMLKTPVPAVRLAAVPETKPHG